MKPWKITIEDQGRRIRARHKNGTDISVSLTIPGRPLRDGETAQTVALEELAFRMKRADMEARFGRTR